MKQPILKQILPTLRFINKNSRAVIRNFKVSDKGIELTDFETSILIKNSYELKHGLMPVNAAEHNILSEIDASEFPVLSFESSEVLLSKPISVKELATYNKFASKDDIRMMLNSVCFNDANIVASNGHILKFNNTDKQDSDNYLLPRSSIEKIVALCKKFKVNDVELKFDADFCYIDTDHFSVSSLLIQREYVKWQKVIPPRTRNSFIVNNWVDYGAFKKLLSERNKAVKLSLKDGVVVLTSNTMRDSFTIGTCDENVSIDIGIDAGYLDLLMQGRSEVEFRFNNELSPIVSSFNEVVMPIRL